MRYHVFQFAGISAYNTGQKEVDALLYEAFCYRKDHGFWQAVEEAVNNAVQHTRTPATETNGIEIVVRVMALNVAVTVRASTQRFDARAYQSTLIELAGNRATCRMAWRQVEGMRPSSHFGLWLMLAGSDYLYMDLDGQSVTIVKSISPAPVRREIRMLVPRFYVRQDGGMLTGKEERIE